MTVPSSTSRDQQAGNGATTAFTVPFRILDQTHISVLLTVGGVTTEQVLTTDYSVSGVGNPNTTVTFVAAPPALSTITFLRSVPATQETDYVPNDPFPAESHEQALDKLTMLVQQLIELLDRSLTLPPEVSGVSTELPAPIARNIIGWNEAANALQNFTPAELATVIAYANKQYQVFAGTGAQTAFTLSQDPGSLGNLEITIDGVMQVPSTDFNYAGTTLTFVAAPANGAVILVRYDVALPTGVTVATAVNYTDAIGSPTYLKTISDMLNGLPVSIDRWINPLQLPAIRDGTSTYDAAADINDGLSEYTNFIVPAGRRMLGSTLLLRDRTTMIGDGWSVPFNSSVQEPRGSVFKLLPGADCDVFRQASKPYRFSLHLARLAIDGDGANQGNVGNTPDGTYGMYQFNRNAFFFEALYNAVFDRLFMFNMRGAGMALHGDAGAGMTNVFISDCHAYNCRTYSIYCEGSLTDLRINGGDFGFGRVANLRLTSSCTVNGAVFWTSQCQDPTDAATHSTGTGAVTTGAGIIIAGDNNKITGCRSEGNAGHGIRIAGNNNKVSDSTLYFNSSTAATDGLFDGVNVTGDDNLLEGLEIRQSSSSPRALRKSITLEAAANRTEIRGGSIRRVGANAAAVSLPVSGFSFADGDTSDFSWATGEVKAYSAAANSIGTSFTKVQFRTETVDARNEWSIANDDFTAAEAGVYRIDTGVNIANVTDGNSFTVAIFKNGAEYRRLGQQRAGAGSSIQICGGLEMKLEVGDVIDVRGICGTANNTNVGAGLTWIEITQING